VYLDFLQNGKGKTMASVYSLRPKPGAMVSVPVEPGELMKDLNPADFNIYTIEKRIADKGDLWKGFFDNRINMLETLEKLNGIY
jgi:bifunctional non-homologous end joining protein LigD